MGGKKKEVMPPLPNNGTIRVYWDGKVVDYELVAIHYSLNKTTGVATCTLNEPQRLNALTNAQTWEYKLILDHATHDPQVKCLLWTGRGRAFSSGADFSGKAPPTTLSKEIRDWFKKNQGFAPGPKNNDLALKSLTLAFWDFPKPSVVAVNGLAVGGAANIALANYHDLVLASSQGKFKYPFADLGLTPELGSSHFMPRVVGYTQAKKMMMLGDWFTAYEAKDMGLVLEVTAPENLIPRALAFAEALAKKNSDSIRLTKRIMNGYTRAKLVEIMDEENRTISEAARLSMKQSRAKAKL